MTWTNEFSEALQGMLALGKTYDECAAKLGTTRGSVASKVTRLKVEAPVKIELISIELPPPGWRPTL